MRKLAKAVKHVLTVFGIVAKTYLVTMYSSWETSLTVVVVTWIGTRFIMLHGGFWGWIAGLMWFSYAGGVLVFKVRDFQQTTSKEQGK